MQVYLAVLAGIAVGLGIGCWLGAVFGYSRGYEIGRGEIVSARSTAAEFGLMRPG